MANGAGDFLDRGLLKLIAGACVRGFSGSPVMSSFSVSLCQKVAALSASDNCSGMANSG
jgi:hypothetical protein